MSSRTNAFGTFFRGARLGYRLVPSLGAWMRVEAGGPPWRVCLAVGPEDMEEQTRGRGDHICWWEGDPKGETTIAASLALRTLSPLTSSMVLVLDDDGYEASRSGEQG